MAAWCYQAVDFCKSHCNTVAIAMNLLYRFVACSKSADAKAARLDCKVYRLAAMTALYTAVKIHKPKAMNPNWCPCSVAALISRPSPSHHGTTTLDCPQVAGPSSYGHGLCTTIYAGELLALLLTKFQTKSAVSEFVVLEFHPSEVAFCSLLNLLENVGVVNALSVEAVAHVLLQAIGLQGNVS
ncbi:hypothetical protein ACA910_002523 [Epithemia clementina (nom. ined.)]